MSYRLRPRFLPAPSNFRFLIRNGMLQLFRKAKRKNNNNNKKTDLFFSAICFSINLHLGMRRFVSDQNSPTAINGRKNLTPKPNAEPCVERRTVPADTKRCEWCRSRRCHRSQGRTSAGLSNAGLGQNGSPGAKQGRK